MSEFTGYHDIHGIPIHVGDLIRVKHFNHRRNHRQMYLYFRVAKMSEAFVVQNWHDLDATRWQCRLCDSGVKEFAEVMDASGLERNGRGEVITFNERPRHRKNNVDGEKS